MAGSQRTPVFRDIEERYFELQTSKGTLFYRLILRGQPRAPYSVIAHFGQLYGSGHIRQLRCPGDDLRSVRQVMLEKAAIRESHGYRDKTGAQPVAVWQAYGAHAKWQHPEPAMVEPTDNPWQYLHTGGYAAQQGYVGQRVFAYGADGAMNLLDPISHQPLEFDDLVARLTNRDIESPSFDGCLLDGELTIDGRFIAYDALRHGGQSLADLPCADRMMFAEEQVANLRAERGELWEIERLIPGYAVSEKQIYVRRLDAAYGAQGSWLGIDGVTDF